jgi:hypothetical protein
MFGFRKQLRPLLALVFGAVLLFVGAAARAEAGREYQVKAAFLFNFAQFVQWPAKAFPSEDAPFVIATVGADPFEGAIEKAVAGKTVASHAVIVKHFSGADQIGDCHLLFVPAGEDANLAAILRRVGEKPVLSVGETDAFPRAGGCIRFYIEDGKVRFEINPEAASKATLKISAKLMSLARIFKR